MPSSEFGIIAGALLASLLLLLAVQTFISSASEEAVKEKYRTEAEELYSLISKISKLEGSGMYEKRISISNITVKNGVLRYQKNGYEFRFLLPENVENTEIFEATKVCIIKKGDRIFLSKECGTCDYDFVCTPDECSSFCPDCFGPKSICIGDGICNKDIGESCENSGDCACSQDKVCCPLSPDADEHGCSQIRGRTKGEQCYCSSQCGAGLECNPTAPSFSDYEKACCEPGKVWDGNGCKEYLPHCEKGPNEQWTCSATYGYGYVVCNNYNRDLDVCSQTVTEKLKEWIYSDQTLVNEILQGKYDNAVRKIWKESYKLYYNNGMRRYCPPACTGTSKDVEGLLSGNIYCGVCNHWAAVGLSLIRTLGVPENRVYIASILTKSGYGHAVTVYRSDTGKWWILDYTCCEALVPEDEWSGFCGDCGCQSKITADNDYGSCLQPQNLPWRCG